jgi:hypothetical protein
MFNEEEEEEKGDEEDDDYGDNDSVLIFKAII